LDRIFSFFKMPRVYQEFRTLPATSKSSVTDSQNLPVIAPRPKAPTIDAWLAQIIQEWKPDIIHTLGLDHEQGGFFYHSVRKTYKLEKFGKWVIQLRGGSDLTLNRYDPKMAARISGILQECDTIICDNTQNIIYAEEMGVPRKRFADIVPIPGTGGIDLEAFSNALSVMPSQRERIILWTKAYNCQWSQALPVFEAIKIAWDRIKPCTIHMLAMPPDVRMWYNALPPAIRRHCTARDRIPRQEVLSLMQKSRVLLSPSLVDGIPNTLYEAMATGVFPIVSPLETIISLVENEQNVLFARNLYPDEIAHAIERSMRDDALLDAAAKRNFAIVRRLADRVILAPRVVAFYEEIGAL
jgi:glycosyltransferase involved in cell wall biosynthesis